MHELRELIYKKFGTYASFDKYEDHDGDRITIENENDLNEAFNIYFSLKDSRPQLLHNLKLYLKRNSNRESRSASIGDLLKVPASRASPNTDSRALTPTRINSSGPLEYQSYLRGEGQNTLGVSTSALLPPVVDSNPNSTISTPNNPSPTFGGYNPPISYAEYCSPILSRISSQKTGSKLGLLSESVSSIAQSSDGEFSEFYQSNPSIDTLSALQDLPIVRNRSNSTPTTNAIVHTDYMESHYKGGNVGARTPAAAPLKIQKHVLLSNSTSNLAANLAGNKRTTSGSSGMYDFSRWRKGVLLGSGGFGSVYLGLLETGEIIAVKQIEFVDSLHNSNLKVIFLFLEISNFLHLY
jgi:hypothetical protein